jgi:hypothetical protein
MADKKPQRLLPALRYSPRQDGGRGGGDYMYMNRGNGYASNPEYAAKFGGGGGAPPAQPPPLLSPPTDQPPVPPTMGPGVGAMDWNLVNETRSTAGLPAFDSQSGSFPSGVGQPNIPQNQYGWMQQAQPDPNGTGGVGQSGVPQWGPLTSGYTQSPQFLGRPDPTGIDGTGQSSVPQWGPLKSGYVQSPAFLQGRAAGATGALPNQQEQINDWYPQGSAGNVPSGMGQPNIPQDSPSGQTTDIARTQDAVDKNTRLTEEAKNTGNDKELARLQAEWDRIAPMAQKYGLTPERLINSYMQPDNPAAEPDFQRAAARAIADDTWAHAAGVAFGRPPNQVEWDEHWRAMNKGGRDPLEGHPAAVQAIQARMQEIQKDNQTQAFNAYQQWAATQQ